MADRGTFNGLGAGTWTKFRPRLICVGAGANQPVVPDSGSGAPLGKYLVLPTGDMLVQYQYSWVAGVTFGSNGYYAFSLPFPALRPIPGSDSYIPIGTGQAYRNSFSQASMQVDVIPILAPASDTNLTNGGTSGLFAEDPDNWFVALVPHCWDINEAEVISGTANTLTTAHNINFAFDAADIQLQQTAGNRTNATGSLNHLSVSSITSSQFTVTAHDTGTGTIPFSYKVRTDAMPSGAYAAFAGPTQPYNWVQYVDFATNFGDYFFSLKYTPRR